MRPSLLHPGVAVVATLILAFPSRGHAQCRPGKDSHEAQLLAYYSAPLAFSADPGTVSLPGGAVRLAGEGVPIPHPSSTIQQTGACFQNKSENSHLAPAFGRPRLALGLGKGFVAEASYLPPVTIADATPNLGSVALSRTTPLGAINLLARIHATFGDVKGPITCPSSALQNTDPAAPCYGSKASKDTFHPNMQGAELLVSTPSAGRRWTLFGGTGVNLLKPRFRVGFTDGNGSVDHTKIEVDLNRLSLMGGGMFKITSRCDLSGQLYSVPSDMTTVRIMGGCRLR